MANAKTISVSEAVKPITVRVESGLRGRIAFAVRRFFDLQLHTIWLVLGAVLPKLRGSLLDVGCGEMPFRFALHPEIAYTGIDVEEALDFGMSGHDSIKTFDGVHIPFSDNSFDNILCTEVLEHAVDPVALVDEMRRVLKPGGTLVVTVPFSARVHHAPYDFHRFTRFRLAALFDGFDRSEIAPRGNDIAAIASKLIVLVWGAFRPSPLLLLRMILALPVAMLAVIFLIAAHLSIRLGGGSVDDPLGYSVIAVK
jgi:SAM-dependent methyltransferase